MIKKIAFSLGIFALAISTAGASLLVKTAHAVTNPLIISAVQTTGGDGKTGEDFVEIYNPNPEPFNLNGYRLVKRSGAGTADSAIKSWSSDTLIPAYSFYLWANSGFTTIGAVPDTVTSSTLADNNGVAIRFGANDTGTLIDSLSWGTTTNGFTSSGLSNPAASQSVLRNSLFENKGYSLAASQPRNSSNKVLPVSNVPDPEPVPQQVDNSTCKIVDSNPLDEAAQISIVVFTNTGNTSWNPTDYIVDGINSEDIALVSSQSVAPGGVFNADLEFPVPLSGGKQIYQWQMSNDGVKFGQKCSLELSFQESSQPVPTEENPTPDTGSESGEQPQSDGSTDPTDPTPEETPSEEPSVPEVTQPNDQSVSITELLINPEGKDDGQEKVELYNNSDTKIDLTNWILDDIKDGAAVTSDKYVLPTMEINPKSYLAITLPAGKAVLNNSKGDVMSLVNSAGEFIDTVEYVVDSSPESKSLSLINNEWVWATPSLGLVNIVPSDDTQTEEDPQTPANVEVKNLDITEVYAAPAKGQVEFLELFNSGDKKINLSNVVLKIGDKTKTLGDIDLLPGKYIALKEAQLPLALLDKGAEIQLLEKDGSKISSVIYEKSTKGLSYSLIDGKFVWTASSTPGEANKFTEIPASTKEKTVVTKKVTTTTKTTPTKTTTTKKAIVKKTTTAPAKSNSNNVLPKNNNLISTDNSAGVEQADLANKGGKNNANIIAMILASLGAGSFAIYKFGFGGF